MSRSFILTRLVNELGYAPDRIEIEHEYTAGRPHTNTSRIDIVVRDVREMHFYLLNVNLLMPMLQMIETRLLRNSCTKLLEWSEPRVILFAIRVLYTTAETIDKVMDECIIIDTEKFPTFADWEVSRDFPIRFLPDMVRPRRLRISKHPQKT